MGDGVSTWAGSKREKEGDEKRDARAEERLGAVVETAQ
jgi:hypothetical protein